VLGVILFMGFRSIWLFIFMLLINTIIGIIYHETKNLYIIGIAELVLSITYLIIFPTLL